jgi:hypothetical protein
MRIDDDLDEFDNNVFQNYNENEIEITMNEIDKLINQISISEDGLRKRNNKPIYLTSKDIDDIDDVIININIPDDYYTNKERRIMKYSAPQILIYIINLFCYMMVITIRFIIYILSNKRNSCNRKN